MAADDAAEEPPERAPMLEGAWENGTMLGGCCALRRDDVVRVMHPHVIVIRMHLQNTRVQLR